MSSSGITPARANFIGLFVEAVLFGEFASWPAFVIPLNWLKH
jgi:hypothetical protein